MVNASELIKNSNRNKSLESVKNYLKNQINKNKISKNSSTLF